jgi:hypothetical protein
MTTYQGGVSLKRAKEQQYATYPDRKFTVDEESRRYHHGPESTGQDEDLVCECDMAFTNDLYNYFVSDDIILECERFSASALFLERPFWVVWGEENVQVPWLNSDAFRRQAAAFSVSARRWLRLVSLVVIKVDKELARWLQRYLKSDQNARADIMLPWEVVPLRPEEGHLVEIIPRPAGKRAGERRQFEFRPKDEKMLRFYDYHVYIDPTLWGDVRLVRPADLAHVAPGFERDGGRRATAFLDNYGINGGGFELDKPRLLRSPFLGAYLKKLSVDELGENLKDADHGASHPPTILRTRPPQSVSSELLSDHALDGARSQLGAGALDHAEASTIMLNQALTIMAHLQQQQSMRDQLASGHTSSLATAPQGPSKRKQLAKTFNRPDLQDDTIVLPDIVEAVQIATPSIVADRSLFKDDYERTIVRLMGNLPMSDVLGTSFGAATSSNVSGPRSITGLQEITNEQRERALRNERRISTDLFRWIYNRTLAQFDMALLSEWLDEYSQLEHQAQIDRLVATAKEVSPLGEGGRKRAQAAADDAKKKGKNMRELALLAAGYGRGKKEADDGKTLRLSDLRSLIITRLLNRDFVEAKLLFFDDLNDAEEVESLRPHERLTAEVRTLRIEEMKVVIAATQGDLPVFDTQSVRRFVADYLDEPGLLKAAPIPEEEEEDEQELQAPPLDPQKERTDKARLLVTAAGSGLVDPGAMRKILAREYQEPGLTKKPPPPPVEAGAGGAKRPRAASGGSGPAKKKAKK